MTATATQQKGRLPWLRWLRRGRPLIVLGFAAFVVWFVASPAARHVPWLRKVLEKLEKVEFALIDLRFKWRGEEPPHPSIAIVAISAPRFPAGDASAQELADSEALRAMSEKDFPWRRIVWVEVVDKLFAAGATVIAFDVVFASENQDDPAFRRVIEKYPGRLVLGMTVQDVASETGGPTTKYLAYPNLSLVPESARNVIGCVVVRPDSDQSIRRIDHFTSELREQFDGMDDGINEIPGFAAAAVSKFTGRPVTAGQKHLIRYQGPRQTYPYWPVHELFQHAIYNDPKHGGGAIFRDKLVFIGATYELAHDEKLTPFGVMPGVEVHAQAAADLLTGARLREAAFDVGRWSCFALAFGSSGLALWLRRAWAKALAIMGISLGFTLVCQIAFSRFDLLLQMTAPLFCALTVGSFAIVVSFVLEQWEKAHTRTVLNRFVSKRIATVILQNAEEFETARRGEKRPVAVLFSDIRSFTSWSERVPAEHLVGQLNEYFERMVPLIEDTEGNAQKFIGDAILAVWGDTHSNGAAEDAGRALASALRMRAALRELNTMWRGRDDRIEITIGIGVNHGDVVVGEVGHPERREFTVLGDGVNFAARLESATKQFHADCLVGESVEALTRGKFVFRQVGNLRVKGKTKPVRIFTPLSDVQTPPPEWLADYHRAIALHDGRQFAEAAALFRDVQRRAGGGDFLCDWYVEKCDSFIAAPPPPEWDASHTLAEK